MATAPPRSDGGHHTRQPQHRAGTHADRPYLPISIAAHRATALTPRGTAVLAILRARELVRELDVADRTYLAPYVADLLVDLCTEAPTA